ncbi:hypothetical protein [Fibrella forsythiae]|uniref:Uncharacterized protein n=1 Tax=Fibrella forsythiae TaxID=2817061 RepID=A0ABS3JME4_9BACT|nr:hypothetical protein [Fibrella forsythiae]MBO0951169.1 hypothetical protein [Fibrella forsythiae]
MSIKQSNVPTQVWRDSPIKVWIVHKNGSVNNTMVVFPWKTTRERTKKFASIKKVLANYRGAPIKECRFYDKEFNENSLLGYMDEHGRYHGGVAFVNDLRY